MNRQNLAHQAEGWQHHDVNRRVGVEPEQVLINHHVAAQCRVEEACVGNDVKAQQNQCAGKHWR